MGAKSDFVGYLLKKKKITIITETEYFVSIDLGNSLLIRNDW